MLGLIERSDLLEDISARTPANKLVRGASRCVELATYFCYIAVLGDSCAILAHAGQPSFALLAAFALLLSAGLGVSDWDKSSARVPRILNVQGRTPLSFGYRVLEGLFPRIRYHFVVVTNLKIQRTVVTVATVASSASHHRRYWSSTTSRARAQELATLDQIVNDSVDLCRFFHQRLLPSTDIDHEPSYCEAKALVSSRWEVELVPDREGGAGCSQEACRWGACQP